MKHLKQTPYEAPVSRSLVLLMPQDVFTGSTVIPLDGSDRYTDQDDTENWN